MKKVTSMKTCRIKSAWVSPGGRQCYSLRISAAWLVLPALLLASLLQAQPPQYQVDPRWPQDLPDTLMLGQVSGITVDSRDHVWLVHRPRSLANSEMGQVLSPPLALCCEPAPAVIEFDADGVFVQAWGGPRWDQSSQSWQPGATLWPGSEHGIHVDAEGNVWLGGNGEGGPNDHLVSKYSAAGELLLTIGKPGETAGSNDTERLGRPADLTVDIEAREVYIADGYLNRRVIVFDSDTGAYKRHWGAYGERPDDTALPPYDPAAVPARQFRGPVHSVELSGDGLVYVADRSGNRIQVFRRDGSFVKEGLIAPATLGNGAVWDMALSGEPGQPWIYLADGQNMRVWILERESLGIVAWFGRGGRQAGQFDWVHNIAIDSQGNLYTAEVNNGRRVQKFTPEDAE